MEQRHESVLKDEVLRELEILPDDVVVDATLGGAGHFGEMLNRLDTSGTMIGIDADADAITRTEKVVAESGSPATTVLAHDNFRNLDAILQRAGIPEIDKALFDLGWSSFHLESGRGFSFQAHEPLLMTYGDPASGRTAAEIVNSAPEAELSDIIFQYGEERFARGIAKAIVEARKQAPILTTDDLVAVVQSGTPSWYHHRRINPATKTFQALRIAVNDEFGAIRDGVGAALTHLKPSGRVAVITFHSIEDRIVKSLLRDAAYAGLGTVITRKPIIPTSTELARNPRARSAKLRVFERGLRIPAEIPQKGYRNGEVALQSEIPTYAYAH